MALTRSTAFVWANFLMEHSSEYVRGPSGPKRGGLAAVDRRRGFGELLESADVPVAQRPTVALSTSDKFEGPSIFGYVSERFRVRVRFRFRSRFYTIGI